MALALEADAQRRTRRLAGEQARDPMPHLFARRKVPCHGGGTRPDFDLGLGYEAACRAVRKPAHSRFAKIFERLQASNQRKLPERALAMGLEPTVPNKTWTT